MGHVETLLQGLSLGKSTSLVLPLVSVLSVVVAVNVLFLRQGWTKGCSSFWRKVISRMFHYRVFGCDHQGRAVASDQYLLVITIRAMFFGFSKNTAAWFLTHTRSPGWSVRNLSSVAVPAYKLLGVVFAGRASIGNSSGETKAIMYEWWPVS